MAQITKDMVHCAYDIGKEVQAGRLSRIESSIEVSNQSGMRRSSAQYYITVFLTMLKGVCYTRTINQYATEYYLKSIGIDFGQDKQKRAAYAVLEHVNYYSKKHGYLKSIEDIANKYV